MILGNLARTDEYCIDMVKNGAAKILIDLIKDEKVDLRVRHYCTGTLRNLSLHDKNKPYLLDNAIMDPLIKLLQEPKMNQVIVYQAISAIKSLLQGGEKYWRDFMEGGGLEHTIKLNEFDESDHIKFESSRIIALLAKEVKLQDQIILSGGLKALRVLLSGNFELLKTEGLQGALAISDHGHSKELTQTDGFIEALLSIINPPQDSNQSHDTKQLALQLLNQLLDQHDLIPYIHSKGAHTALTAIHSQHHSNDILSSALSKLDNFKST